MLILTKVITVLSIRREDGFIAARHRPILNISTLMGDIGILVK